MWELEQALDRWELDPSGSSVCLLPVLLEGLSFDDLSHLKERVYASPDTWQARKRPTQEDLDKWDELGKRLTGIVLSKPEQVGASGLRLASGWPQAGDWVQLHAESHHGLQHARGWGQELLLS